MALLYCTLLVLHKGGRTVCSSLVNRKFASWLRSSCSTTTACRGSTCTFRKLLMGNILMSRFQHFSMHLNMIRLTHNFPLIPVPVPWRFVLNYVER